jgi:hypothetical protein
MLNLSWINKLKNMKTRTVLLFYILLIPPVLAQNTIKISDCTHFKLNAKMKKYIRQTQKSEQRMPYLINLFNDSLVGLDKIHLNHIFNMTAKYKI